MKRPLIALLLLAALAGCGSGPSTGEDKCSPGDTCATPSTVKDQGMQGNPPDQTALEDTHATIANITVTGAAGDMPGLMDKTETYHLCTTTVDGIWHAGTGVAPPPAQINMICAVTPARDGMSETPPPAGTTATMALSQYPPEQIGGRQNVWGALPVVSLEGSMADFLSHERPEPFGPPIGVDLGAYKG